MRGFTLLELLLTMSLVAALTALVVSGGLMVRRSARLRSAEAALDLLHAAVEVYRQEDPQRRYPEVDPGDASLSSRPIPPATTGVVERLEAAGLAAAAAGRRDGDGRLLDPWGRPWRYLLARPAAAAGLAGWNWDPALGHERRWGRRRDPLTGTTADGPLPFPYLHSLGPDGDPAVAAGWVRLHDLPR